MLGTLSRKDFFWLRKGKQPHYRVQPIFKNMLTAFRQTHGSALLRRLSVSTQRPQFSLFSSGVVEKGSGEGLSSLSVFKSSRRWKQLAFLVKATRIPILVGAIYSLGYQNGIVETIRNPVKIQEGTFEEVCASYGVTDGSQISIQTEKAKPMSLKRIGWMRGYEEAENNKYSERVAVIGKQIIQVARTYVRQELAKATLAARAKLKIDEETTALSKAQIIRMLNEDKDVEEWTQALERIEGFTLNGIENWQYVVIESPVPNAFVSEMLPQRFFVTTGLFSEFVANDHELAMILGHEISHLIHGDNSRRNIFEFLFRGLEITLLMLDPTEGMLSLAVASFLGSSRDALVAAFFRSTETEADELGCQLAAMACFDTRRGAKVFDKMRQCDEANGHGRSSLLSSHPASGDRFAFVQKLSEDESLSKYKTCNTFGKKLNRAITHVSEKLVSGKPASYQRPYP